MRTNGNEKVADVIKLMDHDLGAMVQTMVLKAGANGEITVDQLLNKYPQTDEQVTRDERIALLSLAYTQQNKFAPKLDFKRRCEILALSKLGITREIISEIYKVDRRTVTHIINPLSTHYKQVKREYDHMGGDKFRQVFLDDATLNKALSYRATKQADPEQNNKYASGKAGIHNVRGKMCSYDHSVVISWREKDETIEVSGWYYRDLDGDFPESWFCCSDDSRKTSMACYTAMVEDITDRIPGSTP